MIDDVSRPCRTKSGTHHNLRALHGERSCLDLSTAMEELSTRIAPSGPGPLAVAARWFRVLSIVVACCAWSAQAQVMRHLLHTSWTSTEAAPQGIHAMVQAPDGRLWIGSHDGLTSFDGQHFSAFHSPQGEPSLEGAVQELTLTPDGTLWVDLSTGVARIRHGHVDLVKGSQNCSVQNLTSVSAQHDSSVWAIADYRTLVHISTGGVATCEPFPLASQKQQSVVGEPLIPKLFLDSKDTQWLATRGVLYRREKPRREFHRTAVPLDQVFSLRQAVDGSLWMADGVHNLHRGRIQHFSEAGALLSPALYISQLWLTFPLRDGAVWAALQDGKGLLNLVRTGRNTYKEEGKPFGKSDGLASASIDSLLEDSDGDIWVGGSQGIDRFQKTDVTPLVDPGVLTDWHACTTPTGTLWAADSSGFLESVKSGVSHVLPYHGDVFYISCRSDDKVWLLDHTGLSYLHQGQLHHASPAPGQKPYSMVALLELGRGDVVTAGPIGLWRYKDATWRSFGDQAVGRVTRSLAALPNGEVWSGRNDGAVTRFNQDGTRLGEPIPFNMGQITGFVNTSYGELVLGETGVALVAGGRPTPLRVAEKACLDEVTGSVETADRRLWFNSLSGLTSLSPDAVHNIVRDPHYVAHCDVKKRVDSGFPATYSRDLAMGLLSPSEFWFTTTLGVYSLRSGVSSTETHLPSVSIGVPQLDGEAIPPGWRVRSHPHTLIIPYYGVHLAAPDQVMYRYQLSGVDGVWQYVGHRSEAIYTDLKPGAYVFAVEASADGNRWTAPISIGPIRLVPSFYQTWYFHLLCLCLGLIGAAALYTWRLRLLYDRAQAAASERAGERLRIARDLHDTLLQSVQGLTLSLHAATQKLPRHVEVRSTLEETLRRADRLLVEGRDRVLDLRAGIGEQTRLEDRLDAVARDLGQARHVDLRIRKQGRARRMTAVAVDELYFIGREALTNALRHSGAQKITVTLDYGDSVFRLICTDNGRGFDHTDLTGTTHFGLQSMRERSEALAGSFTYTSNVGSGTCLTITVPGERVYVEESSTTTSRRLRWFRKIWQR